MGLLWTAIVGIAYRQRASRHFSGATASLIFYLSFLALFAWQVHEHQAEELAVLSAPAPLLQVDSEVWWDTEWRQMPEDRTRLASVSARRFNAQVAVDPGVIADLVGVAGWETVPESDWRWILQALNPEPDQASLPLLGRAYLGRSETLLLRKNIEPDGRVLTIRLWDSGIRLMPGEQALYLGQLAKELLVQRFGLFSYWKSSPMSEDLQRSVRDLLGRLEQKQVEGGVLLLRETVSTPADPPGPQPD
jgi:hypothetical protein